MDEFIAMAVEKLGIGEDNAKSATGGIINLIKENLAAGDFAQLVEKLPGAEALASSATAKGDADGGGMLGGLMGAASSMLGGKAGGALDLTSILSGAGLDLSSGQSFVTMLVEFVKGKVGDDLFSKIAEHVPALKG